jgi:membrane associated rhomboid family serine protease
MIPLRDDNPTTIRPIFTVALIIVCVAVFFWQSSLGKNQAAAVYALGVIPAVLFGKAQLIPEFQWVAFALTPITSMFLHGGVVHLAGNMAYLWIFGNNIEDAMGHVRFMVFYLLCGVFAVFAQALPDTGSTIPMIGTTDMVFSASLQLVVRRRRSRYCMARPCRWILSGNDIATSFQTSGSAMVSSRSKFRRMAR